VGFAKLNDSCVLVRSYHPNVASYAQAWVLDGATLVPQGAPVKMHEWLYNAVSIGNNRALLHVGSQSFQIATWKKNQLTLSEPIAHDPLVIAGIEPLGTNRVLLYDQASSQYCVATVGTNAIEYGPKASLPTHTLIPSLAVQDHRFAFCDEDGYGGWLELSGNAISARKYYFGFPEGGSQVVFSNDGAIASISGGQITFCRPRGEPWRYIGIAEGTVKTGGRVPVTLNGGITYQRTNLTPGTDLSEGGQRIGRAVGPNELMVLY